MKKRIIGIGFIVLLVGVSLLVYLGQRKAKGKTLYYSGTIEATTQSDLAFQVGGRVENVLVDEGYMVKKGQVLAVLDQSEFLVRREEAQANLDKWEKTLSQLQTVLTIYQQSLPAEVKKAQAGLANAKDVLAEAQRNKKRYDVLFEQNLVAETEWDKTTLARDTAASQLKQSNAQLEQAQSNLKNIAATEKEIEATKAQVEAAQAALELATIQLNYTTLQAPFPGIITTRNVEPGEVVSSSREVLTLSDLSSVDLKIFVDETDLGKVTYQQAVDVKIDTFPDKVYQGRVSYISPEGEFTPKIIQTHKERVKLVYLVKVSIPNPDLELKTGMPADAWLR